MNNSLRGSVSTSVTQAAFQTFLHRVWHRFCVVCVVLVWLFSTVILFYMFDLSSLWFCSTFSTVISGGSVSPPVPYADLQWNTCVCVAADSDSEAHDNCCIVILQYVFCQLSNIQCFSWFRQWRGFWSKHSNILKTWNSSLIHSIMNVWISSVWRKKKD